MFERLNSGSGISKSLSLSSLHVVVQAYIDWTEGLRRESTDKPLFIALKKPHAGVTASNISRWLKEVMQRAAIDIEVFKLHSTHCASVSVAKQGECLCQTFSRLPSQHFRDSTIDHLIHLILGLKFSNIGRM